MAVAALINGQNAVTQIIILGGGLWAINVWVKQPEVGIS